MNKKIVIVNGVGRSGKDSVCDIADEIIPCGNISTVDKVKKAYSFLGWNGEKSEEHRKALSDIKDLATKTLDHSYRYCKQCIADFYKEDCPWLILFIHSREPDEIARFVKDFGCKTLLVTNKNIKKIESNHADAEVANYNYDFHITNDGTLDDLHDAVEVFIKELFNEK